MKNATQLADKVLAARSAPIELPAQRRVEEEPEPLTGINADPHDFPIQYFGPLVPVVEEIVERRKVPPGLAAASVLGVASLAAQGINDVDTLFGSSTPLSLFIISVGVSGERKSRCDKMASIGVRERQRELSALMRRDAEQAAALGEPMPETTVPIIMHSDPTMEGLFSAFKYGQPSQGLFSDEAASLIGGHAMKAENKLKAFSDLSKWWDGGVRDRLRKGTQKTPEVTVLHERRLAVHLLGQPEIINMLIADPIARDQGILARALVHGPKSTIGTRIETLDDIREAGNTPRCSAFGDQIKTLLEASVRPNADNEITRPSLPLTEDAAGMLLQFSNSIERELAPNRSLSNYGGLVNKMPEHATRIAGVLATISGGQDVSGHLAKCGIKIASYFMGESIRLSETTPKDKDAIACEKIYMRVIAKGGTLTRLRMLKSGPKPRPPAKVLDARLNRLKEAKWITIEGDGSHRKIIANPAAKQLVGGETGERGEAA